jgi:hypothetical protein
VNFHLKPHSVSVERIRRDQILHEALTGRPDPLHLSQAREISPRILHSHPHTATTSRIQPPTPATRQSRPDHA